jgi:MFS family permease
VKLPRRAPQPGPRPAEEPPEAGLYVEELVHPGPPGFLEPPQALPRTGFRELMRVRDFRLIWTSQIASQLADKFLVYSLLTVTYQRSGANTQEAVVLLAYTFPSVLLSPIAGIYADRYNKRHLMTATNVARGALILLVPASTLIPYFQNVTWHLLLITLLFSAVGQFFAPAEASALPFIVDKRLLITATSTFTLTILATLVVGLPVSSVLVRVFGSYSPYYVATVLFIGAAAANIAMRTRMSVHRAHAEHEALSQIDRIWREISQTASFLRARPLLLAVFGQLGLGVMLLFTIFTLAQGYMATVLHLDPRDSYLILVPAAAGMGLTAAYLGQGKTSHRAVLLIRSLIALGVLLLVMGLAPYALDFFHASQFFIPFAALVGAFFGAAFGGLFIPAITLLQESTEPEQRGRIFGAMFTVLNLAIALPLFLAGLAADTFGLNLVVTFMGGILLAAGVAVAIRGPDARLESSAGSGG